MKLNRNKLRKLILRESRNILSEMAMGGPAPGTPEYESTAQIIQNVIMSCLRRGLCDEMEVSMMCRDMCADYGCPQFANYCTQRVITQCRQMGL
jgi:hypothetical protein